MKYLQCRRQNRCNTAIRVYKASENKVVGVILSTATQKAVRSENKGFKKVYEL